MAASVSASGSVDVMNIPGAQAAWQGVAAQLEAEGQDSTTAQYNFQTALGTLATNAASMNIDTSHIANAAAQFVMGQSTDLGAVTQVSGLVSAAAGPAPLSLVASSSGLLIGTMATAGAVSMGVGAALVGAIALAGDLASSLFGSAGGTTEAGCPGMTFNPPPDWMIGLPNVPGCVPGYGVPVANPTLIQADGTTADNPVWTPFPIPSISTAFGTSVNTQWYGGSVGQRQIDVAFPSYKFIERDNANPPAQLGDFQKAWFAAWKANAARAINGQKAASEAQVFAHVVATWNRAHSNNGQGVLLADTNGDTSQWYPLTLVNAAIQAAEEITKSGQVWVSLGPTKTIKAPHAGIDGVVKAAGAAGMFAGLFPGSGGSGSSSSKPAAPPAPKKIVSLKGLGGLIGSIQKDPAATAYFNALAAGQTSAQALAASNAVKASLAKKPSLVHDVAPFVPAALGAGLYPFLGLLGPLGGAGLTGAWLIDRHEGGLRSILAKIKAKL